MKTAEKIKAGSDSSDTIPGPYRSRGGCGVDGGGVNDV